MRHIFVFSAVAISLLSCKQRETKDESAVQSTGLLNLAVSHLVPEELLDYPRYIRNKDRPWVGWQWLPGARDDRMEETSADGRDLKVYSMAAGVAVLDYTRSRLIVNNLVDTGGLYGNGGRARPGQGKSIWTELNSGDICGADGQCEHIEGCGLRNFDNPKYRARTLDGTCNDFDNPMMGSTGQRMARNASIPAVNDRFKQFDDNQASSAAKKSPHPYPDPKVVSAALMHRKNAENFNPAPHYNLLAAAWIQFLTHDWFAHARDGENDLTRTVNVGDGSKVTATLADDGKGIRGKSARPAKAFRNNVTHWWDSSHIYGWDKESQARVRVGAKLKLGSDGLLPEMPVNKFGNTQEASAFVDNWWVGLSLLHDLFVRQHNWLVDELPKHEPLAPGGKPWDDERLFETARLIVSALIAKIHTIEWTPQLLYNEVGRIGMQGNWNGVLNYNFNHPDDFKQKVKTTYESKLSSKIISFFQGRLRCGGTLGLLGALPGITRFGQQEHFCSPYALPEEFTSVYRLHAMLPDFVDIYKDGKITDEHLPMDSLVGEKTHGMMSKVGINNWLETFGAHPCGQLTANNFPEFLTKLKIKPKPGATLDMAAMDILRDRERGVPRFNDFREQVGLTRLKNFEDFIDIELAWEIENKLSRDMLPDRRLSDKVVETKRAELKRQTDFIGEMKKVYSHVDDVDLQVGILAEFVRPHGYVISETQFQVFILNASRRLFSDRFLTENYNADFYTKWGFEYIDNTTMMTLIKDRFPEVGATSLAKNAFNAFDIWDRKVDGYSLCPEGSSWFDAPKHAGIKEAYTNLLCRPKVAAR